MTDNPPPTSAASQEDGRMIEPTDAQVEAALTFLNEEGDAPSGFAPVRDFIAGPDDPAPGPEREAAKAALRAADDAAYAERREWARQLLQAVLNA